MAAASTTVLGIVAVLALLGLSAFFSSSESAIFTLAGGQWTAERRPKSDTRATTLQRLLSDPHRLLVTILVGNNVVNIAISSLITVGLVRFLPSGFAVVAATVVASCVVLVFGEIVPKSYGLGNAEEWALTVAAPIAFLAYVLMPIVVVFDSLTRRLTEFLGGDEHIERPYLD